MRSSIVLLFAIIGIISGSCNIKKNDAVISNAYFDKANEFNRNEILDSAFYMYNQYVTNASDNFKKAASYRYMGDITWETGDVPLAEESAIEALKILDTSNAAHYSELCYVYNLLGNVRLELQQYDDAITMFSNAERFCTDSNFIFEILNNKALGFQKKGDYNRAVAVYDSTFLLNPSDQSVFARILHNRARTKWLQNPDYPALPEFWQALRIRIDSQYNRGLNASYAHLSDYYKKIKPDSALWYAKKMLHQAFVIQSPADRIEALDKMIQLGDLLALKALFLEYKRLDDSLGSARATTKKIHAFIRYDSQKSKADYLELRQIATTQKILFYSLIMIAIAVIIFLWNWYNKRRKRIKQEADKEIQQSKLKTSQKVHDVVANGLYRIMNELEHGKTIERDPLLDKIEVLYEKSRDISYDEHLTPAEPSDYSKQVQDLLIAFDNEQTNVTITGNDQTFWSGITAHQRNELQLILTEIMVNMKKHSQAKNVNIEFSRDQHKAFITYTDDGIGFTPGQQFGNGLNNTVTRIKSLNGDVTFGESGKSGIRISILWPLQSITT